MKYLMKRVFLPYGRKVLKLTMSEGAASHDGLTFTPATRGPFKDGDYRLFNRASGLQLVESENRLAQENATDRETPPDWETRRPVALTEE